MAAERLWLKMNTNAAKTLSAESSITLGSAGECALLNITTRPPTGKGEHQTNKSAYKSFI
ncbi:MAG: hypothetical protein ACSLFB_06795 [Acidimicrobiales bacterium]